MDMIKNGFNLYEKIKKTGRLGKIGLILRRLSAIAFILAWLLCNWSGVLDFLGIAITNRIIFPIPWFSEYIVEICLVWLIVETFYIQICCRFDNDNLTFFLLSLWEITSLVYSILIFVLSITVLIKIMSGEVFANREQIMAYICSAYLLITVLLWQMDVKRTSFNRMDKKTGYRDVNGKAIYEGDYVVYRGMEYRVVKVFVGKMQISKTIDSRYCLSNYSHEDIDIQDAAADYEGHLYVIDDLF